MDFIIFFQRRKMALVPLLRKLPTMIGKPQIFIQGIQRIGPRFNLVPSIWNLGKTFVTSNISFKSDDNKSKPPVKPFKCNDCGKSFSKKSTLDQHILDVHLKLKPFMCHICVESFAQQTSLDKHIASQHREDLKLVQCQVCDETFKNSKELETHIRQFHIVTDHQCPHCNKYCTTKRGLNQHIDVCLNSRKFKCSKCGEAFVEKKTLDDHIFTFCHDPQ